jgi:acetoin utilization deacetylase AcuC-like enzyme
VAGTYAAARSSANVALTGAALLLEGESVAYALCRPPGHHAGRDYCGGYCFLNNAAIAAHYLATHGTPQAANDGDDAPVWAMRPPVVALLDIDLHHGNGSQELFYERSDVLFVSIHADPAYEYPYYLGGVGETGAGAGAGYNLNLPLAGNVDNERFLATLDTALEQIRAYAPRYLVVSAGFDTFVDDPLGDFSRASVHFGLTTDAYATIGARIAALGLPTLIVQEGGYATAALGHNAVSLLHGFASQEPNL